MYKKSIFYNYSKLDTPDSRKLVRTYSPWNAEDSNNFFFKNDKGMYNFRRSLKDLFRKWRHQS